MVSDHASLSPREAEIGLLFLDGADLDGIAVSLVLSRATIRTHAREYARQDSSPHALRVGGMARAASDVLPRPHLNPTI